MDPEELAQKQRELIFEAWKAIVGVQMHFNEMLMRVRSIAISLILAVFGAAALSLDRDVFLEIGSFRVHIAVLIIFFGLAGWTAMGLLDRFYFFRMLLGAVRKGTEIEDLYKGDPIFGMTRAITEESRRFRFFLGKKREFKARHKILLFYTLILATGLLYAVLIAAFVKTGRGEDGSKASEINVFQSACPSTGEGSQQPIDKGPANDRCRHRRCGP